MTVDTSVDEWNFEQMTNFMGDADIYATAEILNEQNAAPVADCLTAHQPIGRIIGLRVVNPALNQQCSEITIPSNPINIKGPAAPTGPSSASSNSPLALAS